MTAVPGMNLAGPLVQPARQWLAGQIRARVVGPQTTPAPFLDRARSTMVR